MLDTLVLLSNFSLLIHYFITIIHSCDACVNYSIEICSIDSIDYGSTRQRVKCSKKPLFINDADNASGKSLYVICVSAFV